MGFAVSHGRRGPLRDARAPQGVLRMCHIHRYSIRNALEYTAGPCGVAADDAITAASVVRARVARGVHTGGAIPSGTTADVTVVRFATTESCH